MRTEPCWRGERSEAAPTRLISSPARVARAMSAMGGPPGSSRRAAGLRAGRFALWPALDGAEGVACGRGNTKMNCDEAEILLHGLVDDEVDPERAYRLE